MVKQSSQIHTRFVELLKRSDEALLATDIAVIKARLQQSTNFQEDGLWSGELVRYIERIRDTHPSQLLELEWSAEQYYAAQYRHPPAPRLLEHLYLIGYARVISLMLLFEPHMGHAPADLHFIEGFLAQYGNHRDGTTRILEIGCGGGDLLYDLAAHGNHNLTGIDIAPAAIRQARAKTAAFRGDITLVCAPSLDDFGRDATIGQFDVIIHSHVIEHIIPSVRPIFLENARQLLTADGHMLVITPSALTGPHDNTRLFSVHGTQPLGFHMEEFTLSQLRNVLSHAGFGHFMTTAVLPSLDDHISEDNFLIKVSLEKTLAEVAWDTRKLWTDQLYFQGMACQKL